MSQPNKILKKRGCFSKEDSAKRQKFIRFEHECPNDLWHMNFKGYFKINKSRCNPLTILDDHSRFSLCLAIFAIIKQKQQLSKSL